jgi:hypothetical protein
MAQVIEHLLPKGKAKRKRNLKVVMCLYFTGTSEAIEMLIWVVAVQVYVILENH